MLLFTWLNPRREDVISWCTNQPPRPFISISKQCEQAQKWLLDVAFHSLYPSGALKNKRSTAEPDCSRLDAQLRPRWDDAWWELWVNAALFRNISDTVWLKLALGSLPGVSLPNSALIDFIKWLYCMYIDSCYDMVILCSVVLVFYCKSILAKWVQSFFS